MVTLVWWLVGNALVVAALVPAVWLLSSAFHRRPAVEHLLWFLLLVKLLAPPMFDWPWSLERVTKALNKRSETLAQPALDSPRRLGDVAVPDNVPETALFETQIASDETALPSAVHEPVATGYTAYEIVVLIWSTGTTALLLFGLLAVWRQQKILRASAAASDFLQTLVDRLASQLGVRPPPVAVSSRISTPIVSCLGRPRLVWPAEMSEPDVVAQCEAVVAHELSHLARRDHFFLYVESLVAVCCWWNPLLWLIRRRLRETRELACDALALAAVEAPRSDYARRLLDLSVTRTHSLVAAPAFGAGNLSRRFLKRRITMVFDERASGRISAHGAILAALLTLVGLPGWTLADPPADAKPAEKSESVSTTTSSQSSTSSATSGAATDPAALVPAEPVSRSYLLGVLKNEDISSNKAAEISLGNGGVIRITKNENGDLVVTVEQTESGNALRFNRVGPATGRVAIDVTARTGTNSNGGIVGSASSDAAPSTAGVFSGAGFGASAGTIRVTTARSSGAGTRAGGPLVGFDREMLQSDIALAEVGVMEKRAELEIARQSKTDDAHVKLAELGLKRAEIELERAKLRLKRSETGSAQ